MQIFPKRMCNGAAWRRSRQRAHWLMALVGGGAEGEVCILHSLGIAASPISLLSMGGVCGRSLTAGKILSAGRQTCSLYLVLWLCAAEASLRKDRGACCCLNSLPILIFAAIATPTFFFHLVYLNYSSPNMIVYICLKYAKEKRHCSTLIKWWSDNTKMMLGRNIIVQHYINDGQTMTWWC